MKYKELTPKIFDEIKKELFAMKKRDYINKLIDLQGLNGIVYQCLEEMYYHGRYCYPITYKYRKELSKYLKETINERAKIWRNQKF